MAGAIINEILDSLQELIPNVERIQVDRIVVGLGYTAAHLTTGQVGVCFSFQAEITPRSWQAPPWLRIPNAVFKTWLWIRPGHSGWWNARPTFPWPP